MAFLVRGGRLPAPLHKSRAPRLHQPTTHKLLLARTHLSAGSLPWLAAVGLLGGGGAAAACSCPTPPTPPPPGVGSPALQQQAAPGRDASGARVFAVVQQTAGNPPQTAPPSVRHRQSIDRHERQALCGGTTYVRCASSFPPLPGSRKRPPAASPLQRTTSEMTVKGGGTAHRWQGRRQQRQSNQAHTRLRRAATLPAPLLGRTLVLLLLEAHRDMPLMLPLPLPLAQPLPLAATGCSVAADGVTLTAAAPAAAGLESRSRRAHGAAATPACPSERATACVRAGSAWASFCFRPGLGAAPQSQTLLERASGASRVRRGG